jgi:hypothetical protein
MGAGCTLHPERAVEVLADESRAEGGQGEAQASPENLKTSAQEAGRDLTPATHSGSASLGGSGYSSLMLAGVDPYSP